MAGLGRSTPCGLKPAKCRMRSSLRPNASHSPKKHWIFSRQDLARGMSSIWRHSPYMFPGVHSWASSPPTRKPFAKMAPGAMGRRVGSRCAPHDRAGAPRGLNGNMVRRLRSEAGKSRAVPATVSGERDARVPERSGTATGETWEGVHRATTREPGDLPAWVAHCPRSRERPGHGECPSSDDQAARAASAQGMRAHDAGSPVLRRSIARCASAGPAFVAGVRRGPP